ncbi:DNA mismatch repair protein [Chitinophaga horti]|uniref:DNA mismatch repair protein n=1 Tax=Chitinophaga horti TaxID=2920382 RepID=A0ABY6J6G1_9BACT|nr:DNA mismatch repair protein [Chitinophaga horti]UYQ94192.1 DNA mismatch repair protein [Chitinophaga horti]
MTFYTDKQTLEDLNLLGKFKSNSVFNIFNKVKTAGGERLLEGFFRQPLTDPAAINARCATFKRYQQMVIQLPFTRAAFDRAEAYLDTTVPANYLLVAASVWRKKALSGITRDQRYEELYNGLLATVTLLAQLSAFCAQVKEDDEDIKLISRLLSDNRLRDLKQVSTLTVTDVIRFDHLLRGKMRREMSVLLATVHKVDVYIAVSDVARERAFGYAEARPVQEHIADIKGLRHPALRDAVANDMHLDAGNNLLFLTGANMAGKSTFMKAYGIAIYLAHMGFPVAAERMVFSVREGLYTSINVPDNLQMGYSHFYAEVQRVKTVASAVSGGAKLIVIFDELFKGTNVKDAYDATLAVAAAFSAYRSCLYIISTHIIEVGEALPKVNTRFAYLPTVMEGAVPRYTYRLAEGITADRHGMMIIEQEGLLALLG